MELRVGLRKERGYTRVCETEGDSRTHDRGWGKSSVIIGLEEGGRQLRIGPSNRGEEEKKGGVISNARVKKKNMPREEHLLATLLKCSKREKTASIQVSGKRGRKRGAGSVVSNPRIKKVSHWQYTFRISEGEETAKRERERDGKDISRIFLSLERGRTVFHSRGKRKGGPNFRNTWGG